MRGSSAFHPLFTQPRKREGEGGLLADSEAVTVPTLSPGLLLISIFLRASKTKFLIIHSYTYKRMHTQTYRYTCMYISKGIAVYTHVCSYL